MQNKIWKIKIIASSSEKLAYQHFVEFQAPSRYVFIQVQTTFSINLVDNIFITKNNFVTIQ